MTGRTLLAALRLALGLLPLAAIATQLNIQVQKGFSLVNFFSYFTNLSNLLAAGLLIYGAYQLIASREPTLAADLLRGMAVVNMAVVGLVFTGLLRNVEVGHLLPWVNTVLHYLMPVAIVLEWLTIPPKTTFSVKQILLCQVFPLLYLLWTLIRGAVVGWYPYPFLNPAIVGGYGGVVAYGIGIALVFGVVSWTLLTLANKRSPRVPVPL